jgi:hypothetical protein
VAQKFAAAFTIDAIGEFIANAIEGAAALERLSQESGVAVEQLSALAAAFAQSGVGQDQMSASLKKLNQAISDAAGNATSKAAFAFQALGLSITNSNGSLKTAGQLLPEIADAYSKLADGPNKVAINIDLLGRSANGLIPTLDKGAQGLDDLQAAAIASGAALSGDLAKAAEDLETKFIALKQGFTGTLSTEVLEASIPTLNAFADGLAAIAKEGTSTNTVMQVFASIFGVLGAAALEIDGELKLLGSAIDGIENAAGAAGAGLKKALGDAFHLDVGAAVKDLGSTGSKVMTILGDQSDEAVRIHTTTQNSIENILNAGGKKQIDLSAEIAATIAQNMAHAFDGVNDSSNQGVSPAFLQSLETGEKKVADFAASLKVQAESFGKGIAAQTAYKLSTGELGDAVAAAHKALADLGNSTAPGSDAIRKYAQDTLDAAAAAQKLSVQQQAQIDTKEIQSYIDKLTEEADKLNLGTLAATKYAETHGKLGTALKDSAVDGAGFTKQIDDLTAKLVAAGNEKTLEELSVQALQLQGHLVEAADAAFAFQSKLQKANASSVGDTKLLDQIDQTHALTVAQAAFNEQVEKANVIQLQLSTTEANVAAQQSAGQITDLQAQAQLQDARAAAITQLNQIAVAEQNIATSSGLPKLVQQTQAFQNSLTSLASQQDALTKQIRGDLEDSLVNPLLDAETGAKSLKDAFSDMAKSIEKSLLTIANKDIAQSIFGTGGIGGGAAGGLASLFGGGAGGGSGGLGGLGSLLSSLGSKLGFGGASGTAALPGATSAANLDLGDSGFEAGSVSGSTIGDLGAAEDLGFAGGGHVKAGQHTIIGEHGAEEFIPDTSGTVVPNSKMSQGHTIVNNFTIQSQNGQISRPSQMQTAAAVARSVSAASARNNR